MLGTGGDRVVQPAVGQRSGAPRADRIDGEDCPSTLHSTMGLSKRATTIIPAPGGRSKLGHLDEALHRIASPDARTPPRPCPSTRAPDNGRAPIQGHLRLLRAAPESWGRLSPLPPTVVKAPRGTLAQAPGVGYHSCATEPS